jgi:hypothetical protein
MSERRPKENNWWIKMGSRRRCALMKLDHFTDEWYHDVRTAVFYLREHVISLSVTETIAVEFSGLKSVTKKLVVRSRDSVVGIETGYGLDYRGVGVRVPIGSRISLLHVVHTGSGVHPTSYPMVRGVLSPGVKRPGREAGHSQLVPRSRKCGSTGIHPFPPYGLMA